MQPELMETVEDASIIREAEIAICSIMASSTNGEFVPNPSMFKLEGDAWQYSLFLGSYMQWQNDSVKNIEPGVLNLYRTASIMRANVAHYELKGRLTNLIDSLRNLGA